MSRDDVVNPGGTRTVLTDHDDEQIGRLVLEEAAALGSGADFWRTEATTGVEGVVLADGPHGLRKQGEAVDHLGVARSLQATCFPPLSGLAQSWDPSVLRAVGSALAAECRAADVHVLLGPGVNLRRSPLGGRNFEYFSEDPVLTGLLATEWVSGLQAGGVGAALKHFAFNNQETDRMRSSSDVDERTMREVELRAFRRVVIDAQPWTVMCSYNRVNGIPAAQHHFLLTEVLRDEWGFDGVVLTDWGAVVDRVASVEAGVDLQMPGPQPADDERVVEAVRAGVLAESRVREAAQRVALLSARARAGGHGAQVDVAAQHAIARDAAARSIVLLQNDRGLLPLAAPDRIAVVGELARTPRYQGGGSSRVQPTMLDIPFEEIRKVLPDAAVTFSAGYVVNGTGVDSALASEAVAAAAESDVAVVFLGIAEQQESEGFDRTSIDLPEEQLTLLRDLTAVQPNTVVVVSHGGVLALAPIAALAPAVLDCALLGQAGGGGIADVLVGRVEPSGHLTETIPLRLQDTPAFLDFPGERRRVRYSEGLFVGHRWYDARDLQVAFPFGHGLTYTAFEYGELQLASDDRGIVARVDVRNVGQRPGREVVQAYFGVDGSKQTRPDRVFAGFQAVQLDPGEQSRVQIRIDRSDLAYWDVDLGRDVVEPGSYRVWVGSSSRDLRAESRVAVAGEEVRPPITMSSTLAEALEDARSGAALRRLLPPALFESNQGDLGLDMARMIASMPLERLRLMAEVPFAAVVEAVCPSHTHDRKVL